jgi:gas vesicle protein
MGEITKEEIRERLGNIDQIRDIIFGAHLREYSERFDRIESNLSEFQDDLRDRIEDVRSVLASELKITTEAIEKKLKSLNTNTQEEVSDLRQQVDRVNRKFTSSIEALDEAVDGQKVALRDELAQTRDKLQEDARELKSHVLEELERHFSVLRDAKVSKDDMAEILFELGMRLKGTEFVPELKEAAEESFTDITPSEPKKSLASGGRPSRTKSTAI